MWSVCLALSNMAGRWLAFFLLCWSASCCCFGVSIPEAGIFAVGRRVIFYLVRSSRWVVASYGVAHVLYVVRPGLDSMVACLCCQYCRRVQRLLSFLLVLSFLCPSCARRACYFLVVFEFQDYWLCGVCGDCWLVLRGLLP